MNPTQENYAAFLAIDWSDKKHVYRLVVPGQEKIEKGQLDQTPDAIAEFMTSLRSRFNGGQIAVALEQARGALMHGLLEYDFVVMYPVNPLTVAKFREAFKTSGAKSDPIDVDDILEILLKHRDRLQAFQPDTEQTRLLARFVEKRRTAVDQRAKMICVLKAELKQYFPHALEALSDNLTSKLAHDFLRKWTTFEQFRYAKPQTVRKFFYGHNIRSEEKIEKVLQLLSAKPLTTDTAILESSSAIVIMYSRVIQELNKAIDAMEEKIAETFKNHPEAYLFNNIPGAGNAMAPRLLTLFGTDRSRFETAESMQCLTGVAPVRKQSGSSYQILFRVACPKFLRQTMHEFARLSAMEDGWAKTFVDGHKNEDGKFDNYHAVIRALAFKWLRILWKCWQTRTAYCEATYQKALKTRGSKYAKAD